MSLPPAASLQSLLSHPVLSAVAARAPAGTVHLVGGAVRDALLGRCVGDFDLVVAGGGETLAEELAQELAGRLVRLGGERFAAYRVVLASGVSLDLWDREASSLEKDLARRDLTINAIALELPHGGLVDPFHGFDDLNQRRLVATQETSFAEDPLRVLRLARFAAELPGFRATAPTLALARQSAAQLPEMAAERIRYELARIFAADELGAARGLAILAHSHLYPGLWLGAPGREPSHGGLPARMARLERHRGWFRRRLSDVAFDLVPARWALSFAALGPSAHSALEMFVERGWLLPKTGREVEQLLRETEPPATELEARRLVDRFRTQWPAAALYLAAVAGKDARLDLVIETFTRHGAALLAPPRLLSGAEVQALMGIPPGPEVGKALERVHQAQVEGLVATKEEAAAILRPYFTKR